MPCRCTSIAILLTAAAAAQGWTPLAAPAWSYHYPHVVTDAARRRLVLVDEAGTTWEWDGGAWREVGTAVAQSRIAYHAGLARTVLVAFTTTSVCNAWDGHAWTPVPNAAPAPASPSMAYDAARGRLVAIDQQNQVFEWDGVAWIASGQAPLVSWSRLVYDSSRQRMLLLGHTNVNTPMLTHSWDGVAWQQIANSGPMDPHYGVADDPVRGRIVAHGGGTSGSTAGTWEWDGIGWQPVAATGPLSRFGHTLAFDPVRGQVLAFGGNTGNGTLSGTTTMQDAWAWNGSTWTRIAAGAPASRILSAMCCDVGRARLLLHGGRVAGNRSSELWEFDGARWEQRAFTGGPSAREGHALAAAPGGVLLFGGHDGQYRNDGWLWNGGIWTQLAAPAPPARAGHGIVTDHARGRVVLHGGSSAPFVALSDTWEWDGTSWTQVATNGPSVFFGSLFMTYDPVAGGAVVHTAPINATGTWLWDGATWSNIAPALTDWLLGLGFDPVRGSTLAITRSPPGSQLETWARTGSSWTLVPGLVRPVRGPFDGSANSMLAQDGRGRVLHYSGTFLASLPTAPAAAADVGPACGDPAVATPWVTSFGLPRVGDLGYRLALRAGPSRAAILAFATRPALWPVGPGCAWQLEHGPELFVATDAAGLAELPVPLRPLPSFYGVDVFVELAALEPNAARGFTFSAPVRLHLGD